MWSSNDRLQPRLLKVVYNTTTTNHFKNAIGTFTVYSAPQINFHDHIHSINNLLFSRSSGVNYSLAALHYKREQEAGSREPRASRRRPHARPARHRAQTTHRVD